MTGSLASVHPELIPEWSEKNLPLTPDKITTHASITARPFFEKRGYVTVKEQQVIRHNVALTNYIMEKQI